MTNMSFLSYNVRRSSLERLERPCTLQIEVMTATNIEKLRGYARVKNICENFRKKNLSFRAKTGSIV